MSSGLIHKVLNFPGQELSAIPPGPHTCIAACRTQTGINLDDTEIRAAVKLLDKRGSGYIEFDEFVSWWTSKVVPEHKVCTLYTACYTALAAPLTRYALQEIKV